MAPNDPTTALPTASGERAWKKAFSPLVILGVVLLKAKGLLLPLLKFFPIVLKTGGTMFLSIGVYAMVWGWKYAAGFVLLIFIHESGHLLAARSFGLNAGAPVFIPFMGAFIALKDAPRNAWMEAWVGISGPLAGAWAAGVCHLAGLAYDVPLLIALAWSGYWLNLFNLTPLGQLDGGRVVTALSPWMWIPGFGIMGYFAITRPSLIVWLMLASSIPRLISLFRKRGAEEQRYYEVSPRQRAVMATAYFGLIGILAFAMHLTDLQLHPVRASHAELSAPSDRPAGS
ncbi:MAG: site-2 protease family protein [Myxococcota bacterium]